MQAYGLICFSSSNTQTHIHTLSKQLIEIPHCVPIHRRIEYPIEFWSASDFLQVFLDRVALWV